ncbi:MAG: PHP domain-containing protein [archaeon]
MEIINPGQEDHHVHSLNYSDGMNTIDQLVWFAGKIGLTKLTITDHCKAYLKFNNYGKKCSINLLERWENVLNNVDVHFGVEGDVLDGNGNVSIQIGPRRFKYVILSVHPEVYKGDPDKITQAYIKAIKKHYKEITLIGHPCSGYFPSLDIVELTKVANDYNIAMEFNCANLGQPKTKEDKIIQMLDLSDRIYVNSDAHTLNQLRDLRPKGFEYLKTGGWI